MKDYVDLPGKGGNSISKVSLFYKNKYEKDLIGSVYDNVFLFLVKIIFQESHNNW